MSPTVRSATEVACWEQDHSDVKNRKATTVHITTQQNAPQ